MFKFNFSDEKEDEDVHLEKGDEIQWFESCEVPIPSKINCSIQNLCKSQINTIDYGEGLVFFCLSANEMVNFLKCEPGHTNFENILHADKQHSDLVPGKYEGGLKIWECTKDLVVYFNKNVIAKLPSKLNGKFVLDLGCGSGILGIMCLQNGAKVTFQDYNREVLEAMTIPNVLLNGSDLAERASFYSGDWASFQKLYLGKFENFCQKVTKFDYILTSETIYNKDSYSKLINIFKTLVKPRGVIYVAAKSHYFGVGGTVNEFTEKLKNNNFTCIVVLETSEGISRQIIQIVTGNIEAK